MDRNDTKKKCGEIPLISVLVPVYNVKPYLRHCIGSVLAQTFRDFEMVLVDDGSTDGSGEICDDYISKDSRIRVIHQKNEGLAAARNAAMGSARGTLMTYVDGDDWILPCYLEKLLEALYGTGADMSICQMRPVFNEAADFQDGGERIAIRYDRKRALREMLYQKKMDTSACGKLFFRKMAEKILFPTDQWYEDFSTVYKILLNCGTVACLDQPLYAYRQRNGSIMHSKFTEKRFELLDVADMVYIDIQKKCPGAERAALCRKVSAYFQVLLAMPVDANCYDVQKNRIMEFLRSSSVWVVLDIHARFKNRIACLLLLCGERLLRFVWGKRQVWPAKRA